MNVFSEPRWIKKFQFKYQGFDEVVKSPGVHVHLYGKKFTKPFRKMGHVTIVDENTDRLKEKVNFVKETLKVIA